MNIASLWCRSQAIRENDLAALTMLAGSVKYQNWDWDDLKDFDAALHLAVVEGSPESLKILLSVGCSLGYRQVVFSCGMAC